MSKKQKSYTYRRRSQPATSNKSKRWLYLNVGLALVLILAGIGMLFWLGQQTTQTQARTVDRQPEQQGRTAPDFSLVTLEGEPTRLSDYAGQVVLVNLWATWCPPCQAEMPAINAYYEAHKQEGFVVLAVNSQEETAVVDAFIQEKGFSFPVLLDSQAQVSQLYQVRGLPTSFIIDRAGNIRHVQTGEITRQQLEQIVGALL